LVFELEPMYATSDRRTDGRTTDADHRIMPPRRGHNNSVWTGGVDAKQTLNLFFYRLLLVERQKFALHMSAEVCDSEKGHL